MLDVGICPKIPKHVISTGATYKNLFRNCESVKRAATWNRQRRNAGILHYVQNDDVKANRATAPFAMVLKQVLA
jgi:hypothetical protein